MDRRASITGGQTEWLDAGCLTRSDGTTDRLHGPLVRTYSGASPPGGAIGLKRAWHGIASCARAVSALGFRECGLGRILGCIRVAYSSGRAVHGGRDGGNNSVWP